MRICVACGKEKDDTEFSASLLTSDRVSKRCMRCIKEHNPQKIEFRDNNISATTYGLKVQSARQENKISLALELLGNQKITLVNRKLDVEKQIFDLDELIKEAQNKRKLAQKELGECTRTLSTVNKKLDREKNKIPA